MNQLSNLAYDYDMYAKQSSVNEEYYENEGMEPEKRKEKKKKRKLKLNMGRVAMTAGLLFITAGTPYIWSLNTIMNCNIKIDKQNSRKMELTAELNRLKAEYDSKIDYKKIEEVAVNELGLTTAKKIKYLKLDSK